ncbi:hypothetical protein [Rosettibacter firmus]|uniref:hypothetical protein n=1 Tax=Rosettibacter firmus TaxID=3111522 RepID=UPI00336BEEDA
MNTGQMLLTIGAIFLLSTVILNVNRGLLTTNTTMITNRYGIMATSLATSMIERAISKAFDEKTDTAEVTSLNQLTLPQNLGLDPGENRNDPNLFDDFDDFNCYRTIPQRDSLILDQNDPSKRIYFNTYCQVDYVDQNNPDLIKNQRTWHKRIKVLVTSEAMEDTIRMSTVYSYWRFK